jgi:hypothetical protein
MSSLASNVFAWLAYGVYLLFIYGTMIAAVVLMIVFLAKGRFHFDAGTVALQRGKRFRTVICNPGMIAFCLFWTAMIIYQLFV